jgi:hypothetical protein
MRVLSSVDIRKSIDKVIRSVKMTGRPVAIGKNNMPEVLVVRATGYNPGVSDVTNLNMLGGAFDFLWDEPDLYTDKDIKKRYAKTR